MRFKILNIPVDAISLDEVKKSVDLMLKNDKPNLIVTLNPEMVVASRRDIDFENILQQSDLNLPDGFGLKIAARLVGQKIAARITGTDFMIDVMEIAARAKVQVALVGGWHNEAVRVGDYFLKQYPDLQILAVSGGKMILENGLHKIDARDMTELIKFDPQIILAAFGDSQQGKQEKWLAQNLAAFPSLRVAMGVGGAFDFYAGNLKRAPKVFRLFGFEWLYRLILQPKRFKRIWNAVVVFLYLILKDKVVKVIKL